MLGRSGGEIHAYISTCLQWQAMGTALESRQPLAESISPTPPFPPRACCPDADGGIVWHTQVV